MRRVFLLVGVTAALGVFPAVAQATTWAGVVIAKDAKRQAIVTAAQNGTVRTVRARPARLGRVKVGARLALSGAVLPDGTFALRTLRILGRAKHTRFRAVVVKSVASGLILSAGHSVFPLRLRVAVKAGLFGGGGLQPGDQISGDAEVDAGGLATDPEHVKQSGHVDKLELAGIYISTTGSTIDLAVVHRGLVHVSVPDGMTVPTFNAGDEIVLVVSIEPNGSFTLVQAENEDQGGDGENGVDINVPQGEFTVKGILASVSGGFVAIKVERHPEAVRCAVPDGKDLSGFTVGELVEMTCRLADGRFVLASLQSDQASLPEDGQPEFEVSGFISALTSDGVAVQVQGHDQPLTCARRAGTDLLGFAVGDFVELKCRLDGAHYMIVAIKSDSAAIPEDGKAWFTFEGVVLDLSGGRISVQVSHHPSPVSCAIPAGTDLRGFAVGDSVQIHCHNDGAGYYVASLKSNNSYWPDAAGETPMFTVSGALRSIGTDSVGVQVNRHPELVRCTMPVGKNLSAFVVGDVVEMRCNFHDGRFNLAELKSEHAYLKLED